MSFADVLALPAPSPDARITYGTLPQQFGELWRPAQSTAPLVVLIHGGCWLNAFDVAHSRPLAAALRAAGFAVWSLEYRRIGDPGGGWSGTMMDIGAGVDFVSQLASSEGSVYSSLLVAGHSAGGHLALWCAARARLPATNPLFTIDALQPSAVLGLAAIADLELYAAGASDCERATVSLLGGAPADVPERFAAASPVQLLPTGLPVMLLQGELDPIVPASQPESYLRAALDHGDPTRLRHVPGAGHFDFIHPGTLACDTALASLRELA